MMATSVTLIRIIWNKIYGVFGSISPSAFFDYLKINYYHQNLNAFRSRSMSIALTGGAI